MDALEPLPKEFARAEAALRPKYPEQAGIGLSGGGIRSAVAKGYDGPPSDIVASTDCAVLARGKHLALSIGGCTSCHGGLIGGQLMEDLGPIGAMQAPNLTPGTGGIGNGYTDGELAREAGNSRF